MKILITSGGTREYIDDVRVLTNLSSGRLGAVIADEAVKLGHDVEQRHPDDPSSDGQGGPRGW